jgi:predicted phosphoadenosine phosphosulfate sulfurtransferase
MIYDKFSRVVVSFSGGKDSTVLLHQTIKVAKERGRLPLEVLFIDWEAQYLTTIKHVTEMLAMPEVKPYWICLPMSTDNGSSCLEPLWLSWDRDKRDLWVREYPDAPGVIKDYDALPFYTYGMTFEEFVPNFQSWLSGGQPMATLIGVRADESLRRFKAVTRENKKSAWNDVKWSAVQGDGVVSFFPIYDWRVEDIWKYIGVNSLPYNHIYDRMYWCGMSLKEMRICEPYGPEARKNLDKYHPLEPETWFKLVERVGGANFGAKMGGTHAFARKKIVRPASFSTWKEYAFFLLSTYPPAVRDHYMRRINVFRQWFADHKGWEDIKDEDDLHLESIKMGGSWRMVCRTLLNNDYFCGHLSFGVNKSEYEKLQALKEKYENL